MVRIGLDITDVGAACQDWSGVLSGWFEGERGLSRLVAKLQKMP